MPRPIMIEPSTVDDIRRLCGVYEWSECHCRARQRECLFCVTMRILTAIGYPATRPVVVPTTYQTPKESSS